MGNIVCKKTIVPQTNNGVQCVWDNPDLDTVHTGTKNLSLLNVHQNLNQFVVKHVLDVTCFKGMVYSVNTGVYVMGTSRRRTRMQIQLE